MWCIQRDFHAHAFHFKIKHTFTRLRKMTQLTIRISTSAVCHCMIASTWKFSLEKMYAANWKNKLDVAKTNDRHCHLVARKLRCTFELSLFRLGLLHGHRLTRYYYIWALFFCFASFIFDRCIVDSFASRTKAFSANAFESVVRCSADKVHK